jgi:hypothetical protein
MSTLLDEPTTRPSTTPAHRLRTSTAAVRLGFTWFGVRRSLTTEQRAQAADTFGAEGDCLSAAKRLLDTRHPAFKVVAAVKNRAIGYWKSLSLPYPESGIRLVRQDQVEPFDEQMNWFQQELADSVDALDECYHELQAAARQRLGSLYDATDYPESLRGLFSMDWEFPSIEPPDYLMQLNPELYEQECQRVAARFDDAVQLAEQAFVDELSKLVSHLTERLTGEADGKPKVFRDSAIENLTGFFERFRQLNVRSNDQLDELVEQAQQVVQGVEPQQLRDNQTLRQHVATQLADVQSVLDGLLVDRPRRNILRRAK